MSLSEFVVTYWYYVLAVLVTGFLFFRNVLDLSSRSALNHYEATTLINRKHAVVIDVRSPADFAAGHLPGAVNMPFEMLADRAAEVKRYKTKPLIVVCEKGVRSAKAVAMLDKEAQGEVYSLAGGVAKWKAETLPLVTSA